MFQVTDVADEKQKDKEQEKTIPNYMRYILGGLAGMLGSVVVQPLDLVKTRLQIDAGTGGSREYRNAFDCIQKVYRNESLLAFYSGLSAGLLRQATYTTARMGVYQTEIQMYRDHYGEAPRIVASALMGVFAGAVGAFVGNPAEVALVRMMADKKAPQDKRRNYKNVGDALSRIMREEGILGLWKGCMPTVIRAMIVNMVQLASYSQFKAYYKRHLEEGLPLHIAASMSSGFWTCVASLPLDMAKTKIQNQKGDEYKGTIDVIVKVVKQDGVLALWKGFIPYFCRIGPHTVLAFVFLEQLSKAYQKYVLGVEPKSGL